MHGPIDHLPFIVFHYPPAYHLASRAVMALGVDPLAAGIPLSVALPCTAASYIGAIFIGHFLYNETITLIHLTAVAFIGCGVILLALAAR